MLREILQFFSKYAHPFEKKADKFFRSIKSSSNRTKTNEKLEQLMQDNLVVLNLWMERRYKNYLYLKKRVRKQMYSNVEALKEEFSQYFEKHASTPEKVKAALNRKGLPYPEYFSVQLVYLATVMAYLRPGPHYAYQEGANFGKLLKNPREEKLVGDCNQIVTLYTYLYAQKYPVKDLKIKILPGHVCLHFEGIDIEATNGTFQKYDEYTYVLPITELISTNLLDVVDVEAKTGEIEPRVILKRAQLAETISSNRELVDRNLKVAYRNLGIKLMQEKDFLSAIFFLEKLGDAELLHNAYHRGAAYYIKQKNFKKADYFARHSGNNDLQKNVTYHRGAYYYNKKQYDTALKYFRQIADKKMVKACYQGKYNQLFKKVKHVKTYTQSKNYKSTYRQMLKLANQAENYKAAEWVRGMLKKI